jgi:hypothetical protein
MNAVLTELLPHTPGSTALCCTLLHSAAHRARFDLIALHAPQAGVIPSLDLSRDLSALLVSTAPGISFAWWSFSRCTGTHQRKYWMQDYSGRGEHSVKEKGSSGRGSTLCERGSAAAPCAGGLTVRKLESQKLLSWTSPLSIRRLPEAHKCENQWQQHGLPSPDASSTGVSWSLTFRWMDHHVYWYGTTFARFGQQSAPDALTASCGAAPGRPWHVRWLS